VGCRRWHRWEADHGASAEELVLWARQGQRPRRPCSLAFYTDGRLPVSGRPPGRASESTRHHQRIAAADHAGVEERQPGSHEEHEGGAREHPRRVAAVDDRLSTSSSRRRRSIRPTQSSRWAAHSTGGTPERGTSSVPVVLAAAWCISVRSNLCPGLRSVGDLRCTRARSPVRSHRAWPTSRMLDLACPQASATSPVKTSFPVVSAKPLISSRVVWGGTASARGSVTNSTSAGPGWA
jgi:hypothetical protein